MVSNISETKKQYKMKDVIAVSIPIIITLGAFVMIVIIRRLEHLEKLKMIEKGVDLSQFYQKKKGNSGGVLKFALMAVGVGMGLIAGNVLDTYTSLNDETCYFSMIFLFGGGGLLTAYKMIEQKEKEQKEEERKV